MKIRDFQKFIYDRYAKRDRQRGTAKTFMWFTEEIGELATVLATDDSTQEQRESEFADVFAWLCTLANINDVDIENACKKKYSENCPEGYK